MSTKQYKKKGMSPKTRQDTKATSHQRKYQGKNRRFRTGVKVAVFTGVAIVLLGVIYFLNAGNGSPSSANSSGKYSFAVGNPGPGEPAPPIRLQSTDGSTFDLASLRGKTVLLFFQEGLACQPCWDQIKDIESNAGQFQALGIDKIVSITTDPLDAIKQKVTDEGITTPVLSDPTFAASRSYNANQYGMMNGTSDGHSFLVVSPDGRIRWRADYGGPPDYTMYVPVSSLIADIKEGLNGKSS